MKDLDIVVYGATGFTGKLCADYIHATGRPIKWAIAGRNADKLKTVHAGLSPEVEIIIADCDDDAALQAMAEFSDQCATDVAKNGGIAVAVENIVAFKENGKIVLSGLRLLSARI